MSAPDATAAPVMLCREARVLRTGGLDAWARDGLAALEGALRATSVTVRSCGLWPPEADALVLMALPGGASLPDETRRCPGLVVVLHCGRVAPAPSVIAGSDVLLVRTAEEFTAVLRAGGNPQRVAAWGRASVDPRRLQPQGRASAAEPLGILAAGRPDWPTLACLASSSQRPVWLRWPSRPGLWIRRRARRAGLAGVSGLPDADGVHVAIAFRDHPAALRVLLAALEADVPVVAPAEGLLPEFLGAGGLLLDEALPADVAAAALALAEEPALRQKVVRAQHDRASALTPAGIARELQRALTPHGLRLPGDRAAMIPAVRIEGPWSSAYSLARVNRELAAALEGSGCTSALADPEHSDEAEALAPGARDVATSRRRRWGAIAPRAGAILRNDHPPRLAPGPAPTVGLGCYAWEETAWPPEWVDAGNRSLNVITTTAESVRTALINSGVRAPVVNVGLGVDHIDRVDPVPMTARLGGGFRFLHVSTGLPRKGIDVLLAAWARAFSRRDAVRLVLRVSDNPHDPVAQRIVAFCRAHPDAAAVEHLSEPLTDGQLLGLYLACDVLVAPSRGEGFGLPAAEAARLGRPVVTTAWGGAREIFDQDSAWLVDYRLAEARSHLGVPDSCWAEPDVNDLAAQLQAVRQASPRERAQRTQRARERIESRFRWRHVAARTLQALERSRNTPVNPRPRPVAWITPWAARCGVADYTRRLLVHWPGDAGPCHVYAPAGDVQGSASEAAVQACWQRGAAGPAGMISAAEAVIAVGHAAAIIQYQPALMRADALGGLVERLALAGVAPLVILHATSDPHAGDAAASLASAAPQLARAHRLLVHGVAGLNRLKDLGLEGAGCWLPHGVTSPGHVAPVRRPPQRIAACGFLLPHKGIAELIEAMHLLRRRGVEPQLALYTPSLDDARSADAVAACRARIEQYGLAECVTLDTTYHAEEELLARLAEADLIVFPYQQTGESASGAARLALAAGRPVATTPLPIFADIAPVSATLPGTTPADLAAGIAQLFANPERLDALAAAIPAWVAPRCWQRSSLRLAAMVQAVGQ